MPKRALLGLVPLLLMSAAANAQITRNPLPEPVIKRSIAVEVRDLFRLPDTRTLRAPEKDIDPESWARVSFVRDLPDGRRFANDSRGLLYFIDGNNQPHVYADVASVFPLAVYNRLESGFISFTFHPEFASNGLFYTVHTETAQGNPKVPDFIPIGFAAKDLTYQWVITEWHTNNPAANVFEGTRRELLRGGHVTTNPSHTMGTVEFNPNAKPGDVDYGLLYTSGSDYGFSNGGGPNSSNPAQTQRLDSIVTAILRFDPRSPSVTHGQKGLGDYTIPTANKFAADGDPNTLGEIYAYGFRNAHRLSWDTDGTMFASDIGMSQVEEINIVHEGGNYGWMKREGIFNNARPLGGSLDHLYPVPQEILDGKVKDGFLYPVAMYDHDEGHSVSGGFAYHGPIAALNGKFVFGDIQFGRVFVADIAEMKKADDGIPKTVADVQEVQLYVRDASGKRVDVSLKDLIEKSMGRKTVRGDLHISRTRNGELLITSRQDGWVRMVVADNSKQK